MLKLRLVLSYIDNSFDGLMIWRWQKWSWSVSYLLMDDLNYLFLLLKQIPWVQLQNLKLLYRVKVCLIEIESFNSKNEFKNKTRIWLKFWIVRNDISNKIESKSGGWIVENLLTRNNQRRGIGRLENTEVCQKLTTVLFLCLNIWIR